MTWWAAGAAVVGGIGGALIGSDGAKDAAKEQAKAAQAQIAFQKWLFEQQTALQQPFREAGLTGQDRLLTLLGLKSPTSNNALSEDFGKYAKDFSMADFEADPGYGFRLSEGLKSLDRQAAARGGLISGAALKASQRYGQDMASNEYTNAYNRYQTNRSNQLNPLQSLTGSAQTATNNLQQAGDSMGGRVNESYAGIGNARASSYAGQANAWGNALGGLGNLGMDYLLLNSMRGGGGSFGSGIGEATLRGPRG